MTRAVALALVAAFAVPAHAGPPVESPVKVVPDTRSCPSGYSQIGYVGPEGARWRICSR